MARFSPRGRRDAYVNSQQPTPPKIYPSKSWLPRLNRSLFFWLVPKRSHIPTASEQLTFSLPTLKVTGPLFLSRHHDPPLR